VRFDLSSIYKKNQYVPSAFCIINWLF